MAEDGKQAFDPEATVAQPLGLADAEATVTQPIAPDPDSTISGPLLNSDPEATERIAVFDPDSTDQRPAFDPEATLRQRALRGATHANPFAPKSTPETLQANLSSLGGVNPLVAMANPILVAVPQIRRTLRHPDPAALLASLRDQIESFELSAFSGEISDDTLQAAIYALCALLDESAAATPWGQHWRERGLLHSVRGESGGAEGFFAQLDRISAQPERNADLLEFFYICLALGFEGRYRATDAGGQSLQQVKDRLYALVARRRPRPEALSDQWRTPVAQAAVDAALKTVERANAARAAAAAAVRAAPAAAPSRYALSRWPRRAIWSAVAGIVGASLVLFMLVSRLQDDEARDVIASAMEPAGKMKGAPTSGTAVVVAVPSGTVSLAAVLGGLPVTISQGAGSITLALRDDRQFTPGRTLPSDQAKAQLQQVAVALDRLPGAILVIGYADATPPRNGTNAELSAERARIAALVMAKSLADPKRLATEGRGDAEPIAPNDTEAGRARNRRVAIVLKP